MPTTFDPQTETMTFTVGDGDVLVGGHQGSVEISDLGQTCPPGAFLNKCLPQNSAEDRKVTVEGSSDGLRVVTNGFIRALRTHPEPQVPSVNLQFCSLCGALNVPLVDTGAFCVCEECVDSMKDAF